jgi:hypothetical protein
MKLFFYAVTLLSLIFSTSCAQRVSLSPLHGKSYQQIFYLQGSAPPVQLAPTTAEDAKRITESRARRSGAAKSGRSQRFNFGGGSSSSSVLE